MLLAEAWHMRGLHKFIGLHPCCLPLDFLSWPTLNHKNPLIQTPWGVWQTLTSDPLFFLMYVTDIVNSNMHKRWYHHHIHTIYASTHSHSIIPPDLVKFEIEKMIFAVVMKLSIWLSFHVAFQGTLWFHRMPVTHAGFNRWLLLMTLDVAGLFVDGRLRWWGYHYHHTIRRLLPYEKYIMIACDSEMMLRCENLAIVINAMLSLPAGYYPHVTPQIPLSQTPNLQNL